jgi:hypothetical protein
MHVTESFNPDRYRDRNSYAMLVRECGPKSRLIWNGSLFVSNYHSVCGAPSPGEPLLPSVGTNRGIGGQRGGSRTRSRGSSAASAGDTHRLWHRGLAAVSLRKAHIRQEPARHAGANQAHRHRRTEIEPIQTEAEIASMQPNPGTGLLALKAAAGNGFRA